MSGFRNGAGPNGPVLTFDARSDNDDRPYIVIKTDAYPDGERFYSPDVEDMSIVQIAQLQALGNRFETLQATARDFAADPDHLDATAGAELDKTMNLIMDAILPDLPKEARQRLGAIRQMAIIQAFFTYLANKQGEEPSILDPTGLLPTSRPTGAKSSRASTKATQARTS